MRKLISILLLVVLFVACGKHDGPPEGVLAEDTMIELLAEVHIFESTNHYVRDKGTSWDLNESYEWIFEKYEVDREIFESSIEYYASDPEKFEEMYDKVIVNLTERHVELTKESGRKD